MKFIITEQQSKVLSSELRTMGPKKSMSYLGLSHDQWLKMAFVDYKEELSKYIQENILPRYEGKISSYKILFTHNWHDSLNTEHIGCVVDFMVNDDSLDDKKMKREIYLILGRYIDSFFEQIPKYWKSNEFLGVVLYVNFLKGYN